MGGLGPAASLLLSPYRRAGPHGGMPRVERATRLRLATVGRAEATLDRLRRTQILGRVLAAWREPAWRARRALQRTLNIVRYRQATTRDALQRLRPCFAAWAKRWPKQPPGPPGLPAPPGRRVVRWGEPRAVVDAPQPPQYQ